MDPLSQAVFGASLSQSSTKEKNQQFSALIIGALSGMAPDLDIFIQSSNDPLLFLEYHRHFTHSLFFIPLGALLCALVFYPFIKKKLSFSKVYLFSLLGFATHGLLDACTSYGTQLFWPFSEQRIAWNIVSIIDPLFTLPVLILVSLAAYKRHALLARIAFVYAVVFLSLGLIQKDRAETALQDLAQYRGHTPERIAVKPSFANRHLWKLIYEYNGIYYVDAVKLLNRGNIYKGEFIQKLNLQRDIPGFISGSQQAKDIERFRKFSNNFLALNPSNHNIIIDIRYSFIPNNIKMMWGIKLNNPNEHVVFVTNSQPNKQIRKQFFDMLF